MSGEKLPKSHIRDDSLFPIRNFRNMSQGFCMCYLPDSILIIIIKLVLIIKDLISI